MSKTPTEAAATAGLVKVSRASLEVLQQNGIIAETIGLGRMANGAAMITLETTQDVKAKLREVIMGDTGTDPTTLSANANALANIIKSEASYIKVVVGMPSPQQNGSKPRGKSFAPSAPIDVQSQPKPT